MSQSFCDSDQYAQDLEGVVSCRPASVGPEIWKNSSQVVTIPTSISCPGFPSFQLVVVELAVGLPVFRIVGRESLSTKTINNMGNPNREEPKFEID